MTGVIVNALGGSGADYGVANTFSSSPVIRRSTMEGDTDGLSSTADSSATVSQSTVKNGASGVNKCVACDDGSGHALNTTTCVPIIPL